MSRRAAIITNNTECERHIQYFSTLEKYLVSNGWHLEKHLGVDKILVCACGFHDFMFKKIETLSTQLKARGVLSKDVVITGCLPGTHPEELARSFPGKIVTLGNEKELDLFFDSRIKFRDIPETHVYKIFESHNQLPLYYIKIAQGCLGRCTFCVINRAKGALVSEPATNIHRQFMQAIEKGYRQIFLMAEDTFAYGIDRGTDIIQLVSELAAAGPDAEFYFGSLHVWWLKKYADGLLSLCAQNRIKHLHIGLQHVNPGLLESMGRAVDFDEIYGIIRRIRAACPSLVLSADILVGFPGETEEMFNELLDFFELDDCFDRISHFGFSDVRGARSHTFSEKTDPLQIVARWDRLRKALGARSLYNGGRRKDEWYHKAYITTFNNHYSYVSDSYRDS